MAFFDPFGGSGSGGSGGGSGAPGKDGRGISSIVFVSSTGGSIAGIAGATDTYRINYTDGTTSTYTVKNGNNGEQGPKGDAGEQGPKGDPGEQGPKGDKGDTGEVGNDGLSAYEIAVKNGYIGTEPEWLSSLKGDTGEIGATGPQGIQGEKGDVGEQGPQGIQGEQGPQGEKGDPATAKIIETTLLSTDWNEKQYILTSDLIKENNYISISFGKNISLEQYDCLAKAKIICVTQVDGQIIIKSLGTVPNIDIPIIIVIEGEQIDTINNSILLTDDTTGETYKVGVDNGEMYSAKEVG